METAPTTAPATSQTVQEPPAPPPPGPARLAEMDARTPLTAEELAGILGCHVKTVFRSVSKGELPQPFKFLGRKRWTAGRVLDFMAARQAEAISADGR